MSESLFVVGVLLAIISIGVLIDWYVWNPDFGHKRQISTGVK